MRRAAGAYLGLGLGIYPGAWYWSDWTGPGYYRSPERFLVFMDSLRW